MFGNKKIQQESLSQIFLQPRKTKPAPAPVPRIHTQMSKPFLAFLAIICTTTVTAFFIVNTKGIKPEVSSKTTYNSQALPPTQKQKAAAVASKNSPAAPQQQPAKEPAVVTQLAVATTAPLLEPEVAPASSAISNDPVYTPITRKIEDKPITEVKYRVRNSALVYKRPEASSSRVGRVQWQKTWYPFNALAEENGFVYAIIANRNGHEVEGWVRKQDLVATTIVYHASDAK